uniref:Uncharacterized protein n=1 Tax=Otus sunia TaxID=257818 RepID=A0A8C8BC00_9STRI
MKRIFGFGRKRKGQPLPGSASLPCPAGAYEIRQKDLGKLHRAAASGDLAQVRQGLKKYAGKAALPHLGVTEGEVNTAVRKELQCRINAVFIDAACAVALCPFWDCGSQSNALLLGGSYLIACAEALVLLIATLDCKTWAVTFRRSCCFWEVFLWGFLSQAQQVCGSYI